MACKVTYWYSPIEPCSSTHTNGSLLVHGSLQDLYGTLSTLKCPQYTYKILFFNILYITLWKMLYVFADQKKILIEMFLLL